MLQNCFGIHQICSYLPVVLQAKTARHFPFEIVSCNVYFNRETKKLFQIVIPLTSSSSSYFIYPRIFRVALTQQHNGQRSDHNTGNSVPLCDECVVSLLTITAKMQETGPTVYRPYPRRLQIVLPEWKKKCGCCSVSRRLVPYYKI